MRLAPGRINPKTRKMFQSRCRDSFSCDRIVRQNREHHLRCFSPVAGIHLVATASSSKAVTWIARCFSPVAGIHLVATPLPRHLGQLTGRFQSRCRDSFSCDIFKNVLKVRHVPWFQSRCRDSFSCDRTCRDCRALHARFSPVAGIHLVATPVRRFLQIYPRISFSPVAGIHLVATYFAPAAEIATGGFQSRCRDSFSCDLFCSCC